MPKPDSTSHALFHVNPKTGERVRYPKHSFPALTPDEAQRRALGSKCARGGTRTDGWETQAHPEIDEAQIQERRRKAKRIVSRLVNMPTLG